ncbi:MAG: NAD(P)H-quinone oxidoreductase [Ardenticatenaceae bacterium]|nr:NAD(P)H-quinone oxidoreductase [Ardenticatenaceae bacterium]
MKAITIYSDHTPPRLVWETVDPVTCGSDEVIVDVMATAVNRADLMQAAGHYPPPPGASEVLGLEMAGIIASKGTAVTSWEVGNRVCALLPGGGYGEQVAVPADMLIPLPDEWSFAMGAAVPEVWLTAFVNLFLEGKLQAGETVLIHAGGSGVGTAAIQLAREAGAIPFITAGTEAKLIRGRELGAALAINYKTDDFYQGVMAATQNQGVHLILDPVGADYLDRNMRSLTFQGRLIEIGLLSGAKAPINLALLLGKRLTIVGSTLRSRPVKEKIAITAAFRERYWPLLVDGKMEPIIDKTFPITQAQEAHQYVRENKNIGKVILQIRE